MSREENTEEDPLWYKDAIIYEVHVKAFCDTAGDGIGDFKGLTSKLDYLKDLGITALWLLPFYPSPLKDDGYDISDHFDVHPLYGSLKDFKEFVKQAHQRGIKVITELVLNHTSDQHPWFKKSRTSEPGTRWRDFYVWSNTPDRYKEARIIFKDFEGSNWSWDNVAKAYYWHRFYSHQPDLNFANPLTDRSMLSVVGFWLRTGVDGLRMDAVPYLFEKEGTNCENLPETHDFLKKLRLFVDTNFKNRMLLAEANQWPSDAAQYFAKGDECNMAFHFPLMPRMFMSIQMEDRFPIIDILEQTPPVPESCQWALFLRNHDELTLEMVTDEERDYMYRVYAKDKQSRLNLGIRRRLAPLLGNDRRKIELMNILLFTLPGTPVIYYGDEIGMGDNFYLGDRNGVRTPMQWSADLNAGFSKTNPQKLYLPVIIEPQYHYEAINVENQQTDPASLLWWMKRLISVRKNFKAFSRGSIEFLYPSNTKVLAYVRKLGDEIVLVVANLSGKTQVAELDLARLEGYKPRDIFGGSPFPQIGKGTYRLTFTPYGYYAFSIRPEKQAEAPSIAEIPQLAVARKVRNAFSGRQKDIMESQILPAYLKVNRWFSGKGKAIEQVKIKDVITISEQPAPAASYYIVIVEVHYNEGLPESYLLPLGYSTIQSPELNERSRSALVAKISLDRRISGILYDAVYDESFRAKLLDLILNKDGAKGLFGEIRGALTEFPSADDRPDDNSKSRLLNAEQSNTSIVYGEKYILKIFRRLEDGPNPEVEIMDMLSKINFEASPRLCGTAHYHPIEGESSVIGVLEQYVRNEGDAWTVFQDDFEKFIETINAKKISPEVILTGSLLSLAGSELPDSITDLMGEAFLDRVTLLGRRTGEFHLALLNDEENPEFRPEPLGYLEQVAIAQSMTSYSNRTFMQCRSATGLEEPLKKELDAILSHQPEISGVFAQLKTVKIDSVRSRIHGDYHLGQVLFTGKDYVIIDFEGEPVRSLSDRRLKRSAIRDVAGMIRSFHYVALSSILKDNNHQNREIEENLERWADIWYKGVSVLFLGCYLETVKGSPIVPSTKEALSVLLNAYLLEKSIYELGYELNNRPSWMRIPLRGIADLLGVSTRTVVPPEAMTAQQK